MVKAVGILCSNCVFTARKFAMVMFLQVCVCPRGGGGMRGRGVVMHGRGACVVGACLAGGMCGRGGMHGRGANVWQGGMCGRGHVWWGGVCGRGGMHGRTHVCHTPLPPTCDTTRYGWSMRGRYASYWNAFLFQI